MSRTISEQLLRALKKIDRPGTFCTSGGMPAVLPGLKVVGLGPVGLPLAQSQAKELIARCKQAPYGKGEKTLVDTSVRRVWQLDPDQFTLTNPDWDDFLQTTVQTVQKELGLKDQKLESHLYNLLVYEKGSFFLPHRDGEKLDRMVATLVVLLPSAFQGGELVVRHEGQEQTIDFGGPKRNPSHTHFAAFYADCEHEVRPLREGYRLCLVYNLTLAKAKKTIAAPRTGERVEEIAAILRTWPADGPHKLAVLLDHKYTQNGLTWDALKGTDRAKANVLHEAAGQAGCQAFLALLTFWESGSAVEEEYDDDRYRRWDDEEDEDEEDDEEENEEGEGEHEMDEVFDSSLTAEHWSAPDGKPPALGKMEVEREEIVPEDQLTAIKPQEEYEGFTGNEGSTLERWYRHAAVFLWPDARHFEVLCDCGLSGAIAHLAGMVRQWETKKGKTAETLRSQCADLAGRIMARWGTRSEGTDGAKLFAALAKLDDLKLIGQYLREVLVRDPRADTGKALAAVCEQYGWANFHKDLAAIFANETRETIGRNVRLLETLGTAKGKKDTKARLALCQEAANKVLAALERLDGPEFARDWQVQGLKRAELIPPLVRALVATELAELLGRLVTHILRDTNHYPLATNIAVLEELGPWLKKHAAPGDALPRWLAACREQLEALTATEPTQPTDMKREANFSCKCADCAAMKHFLTDPQPKVYRFAAGQERRKHLERSLNEGHCDVTRQLDQSSRPHALVLTKTTASFEARHKKYRDDLKHLAALRAIEKALPK